jgi:hypothetical protein
MTPTLFPDGIFFAHISDVGHESNISNHFNLILPDLDKSNITSNYFASSYITISVEYEETQIKGLILSTPSLAIIINLTLFNKPSLKTCLLPLLKLIYPS